MSATLGLSLEWGQVMSVTWETEQLLDLSYVSMSGRHRTEGVQGCKIDKKIKPFQLRVLPVSLSINSNKHFMHKQIFIYNGLID